MQFRIINDLRRFSVAILLLIAAGFSALPATSASVTSGTPIYTSFLVVPGVRGDWHDAQLREAMPLLSFTTSFAMGPCGVLTVTRRPDRNSAVFAAAATARQTFRDAVLVARDARTQTETFRIVYRNIIVARVELTSGSDHGVEKIDLAPASRSSIELMSASPRGQTQGTGSGHWQYMCP